MSKGKEILKVKVEYKTYAIEQLEDSSTVYKVLCSYKSPYGNWNNYIDLATAKTELQAIKKLIKHLRDKEKDYLAKAKKYANAVIEHLRDKEKDYLAKAKKYANAVIELETKLAKDEGI